jgi:hypothetical protein
MFFETFVIFSILSHVFLVFSRNIAIIGCFDVIQEETMQISKAKHLNTFEDFEKTTTEDSRVPERHYEGMNSVLKS